MRPGGFLHAVYSAVAGVTVAAAILLMFVGVPLGIEWLFRP